MIKPKIEMETKEDRFKRIAAQRTRKILYYLKILGNCANKSAYSYTTQDTVKIFNAIDSELKLTKAKFENKKNKNEFSL